MLACIFDLAQIVALPYAMKGAELKNEAQGSQFVLSDSFIQIHPNKALDTRKNLFHCASFWLTSFVWKMLLLTPRIKKKLQYGIGVRTYIHLCIQISLKAMHFTKTKFACSMHAPIYNIFLGISAFSLLFYSRVPIYYYYCLLLLATQIIILFLLLLWQKKKTFWERNNILVYGRKRFFPPKISLNQKKIYRNWLQTEKYILKKIGLTSIEITLC